MIKCIQLKINGKVQGVWYRGSMQQKARELQLKGFVKNEADGSVFAEVEGPESALEAMVHWCKTGPELAVVDQVHAHEIPQRHFESFEVQRG